LQSSIRKIIESEVIMTKDYYDLTFTDDFMFCKILQENPGLTKQLVEMILDVEIKEILKLESQHVIEDSFDSKGIRLDVYFTDDKDIVYDIEMQVHSNGNLPTRTRYYHSLIAVDNLNKGAEYNEIKHSYVIFICNYDPFKLGLPKYTTRTRFDELPNEVIDDGAISVYLNCTSKSKDISPELQDFFMYVYENSPAEGLTKSLENALLEAKKHKKWRREYMTLHEHEQRAREEGRKEGREESAVLVIPEFIKLGLTLEEACAKAGITVERYNELMKS